MVGAKGVDDDGPNEGMKGKRLEGGIAIESATGANLVVGDWPYTKVGRRRFVLCDACRK